MNLIKILIFCLPLTIYCQTHNHIVEKVSHQICNELNEIENISELTKSQAQNILAKVFFANRTEWNTELDNIEHSRNNGYNIFDNLLNHRLNLTCPKFKIIDYLFDNYLEKTPSKRALYLDVKDFIISAELETDTNKLLSYFSESPRNTNLTATLQSLQRELSNYKTNSGLHIMWSEYKNMGSVFIVTISEYQTGNENVLIKIIFENENDRLIDGIVFKNKAEIELERKEREKQTIDFIPPPPHPTSIKKKN
jgi:hypothetical protein